METPIHIRKRIRQRFELDENDDSQDATIDSMTPQEKIREVVAWELGDPEWADIIIQWAKDCGMKIDE